MIRSPLFFRPLGCVAVTLLAATLSSPVAAGEAKEHAATTGCSFAPDATSAGDGSGALRPLRFADIIEQQEVLSPRISPDGNTVAYLVRQASLATNASRVGLWVVEPGLPARQLLEETAIGNLAWLPDGSALVASLPRKGTAALWTIPLDGGEAAPMFAHPAPPLLTAWAPQGDRMVFTALAAPSEEETDRIERTGIVYDEHVHGIRSFTRNSWTPPSRRQLWLYRKGENTARFLGDFPPGVRSIRSLSWSADGRRLAVAYEPDDDRGKVNYVDRIGILDPASGADSIAFTPVVADDLFNRGATWSPDGKALAFWSGGDPERYPSAHGALRTIRMDGAQPVAIPMSGRWYRFFKEVVFGADGGHLLFEYDDRSYRSRSALYRVPLGGGAARRVIADDAHFSEFSFSADRRRAAAIRQGFDEPPQVSLVDLDDGSHRVLTQLNPQFRTIRLNAPVECRWHNRYGHESNGYLVLPPGFEVGKPVPLLVIQYGFSYKFTTQAQWITSYPVQMFADAGFAVLLHNYPYELGWRLGDFEAAALSQAYSPLASLEEAVRWLVDEGVADPARKGIMGWSFGAWLAELAITQSDLFDAASAGEGGLNNAGQYWVTGSAQMQRYLDGLFGGPPFGDAYPNYRRLAPAFNADKVDVPLLREYGSDVGVQSLEFYMALRRLGKQVEQVIYPGAPHNFDLPSHRLASMERNLDWFRFWLQGVEDPSDAKQAQYARWRKMRENQCRPFVQEKAERKPGENAPRYCKDRHRR